MIRNDINGLKGIAILCVIFYHISDLLKTTNPSLSALFGGGFLGVDIFFVISGYLTCRGILSKCDDNSFSVISFYTKRILRIIPPLIAVCLFTLILGYFLLFPNVYEELAKEALSAFLFIANYRFADSGGYFSLSSQDKPLLHTWYLAVTFQFYLIFPIVLIAVRKIFGNERVRFSILILFIISLVYAAICSRKGQGYLLTECRIWEILLGCALYSYENRLHNFFCKKTLLPRIIWIVSTLFLLVSVFYVSLDNGFYYIESSASTVVATALLLLLGISGKSLYTFKPLCYLGIISYSLYLWHWPLMIFAQRCGIFSSISQIIFILVLLTALSYLSYRYIEKTVFSGTAVALSFVLCIGASFFIIKSNGDNYLAQYMVKEVQVMVNDDLPLEDKYSPRVVISENNNHVYQYGDQTKTPSIFIIGDSHSEHYNYYLKNINKLPVYSLYMHATLAYGSRFNNYKVQMLSGPDERHTFYSLYTQMLEKLGAGSSVVLANRWDLYYMYYLFEHQLKDNKENFEGYLNELCLDIDEMVKKYPNLDFFIVGQGIVTSDEIVNCLKTDLKDSFLNKILDPDKCKSSIDYFGDKTARINHNFIEYSKIRNNVFFIDRNEPLKLSKGIFKTYSDGNIPLFYDTAHLSSMGGCVVGEYIIDKIKDKNSSN